MVAACSRAQDFGIRVGMPLAEVAALQKHFSTAGGVANRGPRSSPQPGASQLAESKPVRHRGKSADDWVLEEHDGELDRDKLVELAVWCERFSPVVGLEDVATPSSLLLDVTGLAPVFGSEQNLVRLVRRAFDERGYAAQVGLADTVGAAWALAHFGEQQDEDASADSVDSARDTTELLGPLPVEALRLHEETSSTLRQLGVETISQLLQLPRDGLAMRLGELLLKRIDQALGIQPEVITALRPPPHFAAEWNLEHPTSRRETIDTMLRELTKQVSETLAQNDHAAVQVEAELVGARNSRTLPVSLFQPSSNPDHLFELLQLQLENSQMREAVRCVRLTATTTVRINGEQTVLWDEVGQGRDREVAQLVDRLSSRLGKECVFGIQAQAGALPEKSWRKKLLADTIKSGRRKPVTANTLKAPHRPLWLHDPPLPLQVQRGRMPDGETGNRESGLLPPAWFQFQSRQYEVARHWGPERIETGWWRGSSERRDYYRVETTAGYRFWLFRQLNDGAWFLHGCFE